MIQLKDIEEGEYGYMIWNQSQNVSICVYQTDMQEYMKVLQPNEQIPFGFVEPHTKENTVTIEFLLSAEYVTEKIKMSFNEIGDTKTIIFTPSNNNNMNNNGINK